MLSAKALNTLVGFVDSVCMKCSVLTLIYRWTSTIGFSLKLTNFFATMNSVEYLGLLAATAAGVIFQNISFSSVCLVINHCECIFVCDTLMSRK